MTFAAKLLNNHSSQYTEQECEGQYFSKKDKFWSFKTKDLLFGVEVEYIVHKKNQPNLLLNKKAYDQLSLHFLNNGYERKINEDGYAEYFKRFKTGHLRIGPDFAHHILEISFPPIQDIEILADLYFDTKEFLESILNKLDYTISPSSKIDLDGKKFELLEMERLKGHSNELKKINPNGNSLFPATITSTHIHLNILDYEYFKNLKSLYFSELISLNLFEKKENLENRLRLYNENLGSAYLLKTIPENIPTTIKEYVDLYNRSAPLFPHNKHFPVKDLCFIRPTSFGTVEFRGLSTVQDRNILKKCLYFKKLQALLIKELNQKPRNESVDFFSIKTLLTSLCLKNVELASLAQSIEEMR